jgi:hypothetical protein
MRFGTISRGAAPAGLVGIGGGNVMDVAKALSLMLTNEGSSVQYQGLNLIQKPGIYHCGVPTISGTGAEVSMTAVLTGPVKKLGLKCDWTVFDQIVLDPDLIASVPTDQWFYTGMDTYIHSVEAITGTKKNTFAEAYSEKALELCREVFLKRDRTDPKSDEFLMVASYMGGLSLTYSEVGVCHALSYGLGKVLEIHHCLANCIAFDKLEDVYGDNVQEFGRWWHNIHIPQDLPGLSEETTTRWPRWLQPAAHVGPCLGRNRAVLDRSYRAGTGGCENHMVGSFYIGLLYKFFTAHAPIFLPLPPSFNEVAAQRTIGLAQTLTWGPSPRCRTTPPTSSMDAGGKCINGSARTHPV